MNFHTFHALFSTRLSQLGKGGSGNAHGCAKNAENKFGFDFLERYHKDGDEFLSHIVRVTGDEIWVSFVNVETKKQSNSVCTHIHQTSQKVQTNFVCLIQS
jgi:hypothetical protein